MGNLSMAPNELRACANVFVNEAERQNEIYAESRRFIMQARHGWLGDAYEEYFARFNQQETELRRRTELLREFAALLKITADDFERMDGDVVRFFSNV